MVLIQGDVRYLIRVPSLLNSCLDIVVFVDDYIQVSGLIPFYSRDGHSTMVHEIAVSLPRKPSVVVLSVGGGGLLSGVLRGLHHVGWSDVPVVGMETEGANCLAASIQAGRLVTIPAITRYG
jgi:threonine synthase